MLYFAFSRPGVARRYMKRPIKETCFVMYLVIQNQVSKVNVTNLNYILGNINIPRNHFYYSTAHVYL